MRGILYQSRKGIPIGGLVFNKENKRLRLQFDAVGGLNYVEATLILSVKETF